MANYCDKTSAHSITLDGNQFESDIKENNPFLYKQIFAKFANYDIIKVWKKYN